MHPINVLWVEVPAALFHFQEVSLRERRGACSCPTLAPPARSCLQKQTLRYLRPGRLDGYFPLPCSSPAQRSLLWRAHLQPQARRGVGPGDVLWAPTPSAVMQTRTGCTGRGLPLSSPQGPLQSPLCHRQPCRRTRTSTHARRGQGGGRRQRPHCGGGRVPRARRSAEVRGGFLWVTSRSSPSPPELSRMFWLEN